MSADPVVESIRIAAPSSVVYDLVADVGRMGEWSPEATGARGQSGELAVGQRFLGTNKRGLFRWITQCTVIAAAPGEKFAFDVDFGPLPVSRWSYHFEDQDGETVVTETWWDRRRGVRGAVVKGVGQVLIPGPRPDHNRRTMKITLRRLKQAAEAVSVDQ